MPDTTLTRNETWAYRVATTFGLGDLLPAPGTFAGSLPAAACWFLLALLVQWIPVSDSVLQPALSSALQSLTAALVIAAIIAAIWAADIESHRRGRHDPGPVVADEVAGQLVTYLVALPFLVLTTWWQIATVTAAGFLLFRLFDIVKPWPANRLERLPGGLGIVADDLAAGVEAGIILAILSPWLLTLLQFLLPSLR